MKRFSGTFMAVAFALGLTACGDDDDDIGGFADSAPSPDVSLLPDAAVPPPDAPEGTPDAEPLADAPLPLPDGPTSALGPQVVVLNPQASTTFESDKIVTSAFIVARCRATANPTTTVPVDSSSVTLTVIGDGASTTTPAVPTPSPGVYEATFAIGAFPNGPLSVRCTAADTASPPEVNSAQNDTFLDLGPKVTVYHPLDGSYHSDHIDALFRVEPAPVATGDTGAAVGSIRAFAGAVELTVTGPDGDGNHSALIDFDAPAFTTTLDGPISFTVVGTNTRTPTPTSRSESVVFVADAEGPDIEIVSPEEGEIVSGLITIAADVSDPAGVDSTTVVATVALTHEVPLMNTGGVRYEALFDTRLLPSSMVYPNIDVRARDSVGNESVTGQEVALDNFPPLVSLDPPLMREARFDSATGGLLCSRLFDPVGNDAISDGESVAQLSEIRARIEDVGNGATAASSVEFPRGDVDSSSVQLFVLDDETAALLVDTDGDTLCDAINPAITPATIPMIDTEAAVLDLAAIPSQGQSHFATPLVAYSAFELAEGCGDPGAAEFPANVCLTVEATRVIRDELTSAPVIYGIPPLTPLACMGTAFDSAATNIADGWACLAVRAGDTLGNVGVSPPIRVCFDADGDGAEGCPAWGTISTPPTSCTDGCTVDSFADFEGFQLRRIDL